MARLISRDYSCKDCGHLAIAMIPSDEDHWQPRVCPECGGCWEHSPHLNISTEKMSQSIPDVVAKNRFKDIKEERAWKKKWRTAKNSGKKTEAAEIRKEANKAGVKI